MNAKISVESILQQRREERLEQFGEIYPYLRFATGLLMCLCKKELSMQGADASAGWFMARLRERLQKGDE